jgi:hypothetical protein
MDDGVFEGGARFLHVHIRFGVDNASGAPARSARAEGKLSYFNASHKAVGNAARHLAPLPSPDARPI